jgi:protease I
MGKNTLEGKKVAILVADGFEQEELTGPKEALEAAGAEIQIVSPAEGIMTRRPTNFASICR